MSGAILAEVLSEEPKEMERRMWRTIAYCTRYGRQRIADLLEMPQRDVISYFRALSTLVRNENEQGGSNVDEDG